MASDERGSRSWRIHESAGWLARNTRSQGLPTGTGRFSNHYDKFGCPEWLPGRFDRHRRVSGVDRHRMGCGAMVTRRHNEQGSMMIEMVVALTIIVTVLIPLGFSFVEEQHV